jgi:hypothetical protein
MKTAEEEALQKRRKSVPCRKRSGCRCSSESGARAESTTNRSCGTGSR